MPVITIRGHLGGGAMEIGKEVARLIQGDYIDRQVIAEVAKKVGHPEASVEEKEQVSGGLGRRILATLEEALARSGSMDTAFFSTWEEPLDDELYLDALKSVIKDIALQDNAVFVGRGSQFILSENSSILNVMIYCPRPIRVKRIMARLNAEEAEAAKRIDEYDSSQRAFIHRFFKRDADNFEYYDMIINTTDLSFEVGARLVVEAANAKTPWAHG